jgi:hypothetical protein
MPLGLTTPAADAAMSMSQTRDSLFGLYRRVSLAFGVAAEKLQAFHHRIDSFPAPFPFP